MSNIGTFLNDRVGEYLYDFAINKYFLNRIQNVPMIKNINTLVNIKIKIKNSYSSNRCNTKRVQRQASG